MSTTSEKDVRWYIIHTYSGQEERVKRNLDQRISSMDIKDRILQVVVPTEEEIEIREGKRRSVRRKVFPGYILVQMSMDDHSWHVVRETPGVTGFVSSEDEKELRPKPVPRSYASAVTSSTSNSTPLSGMNAGTSPLRTPPPPWPGRKAAT